MASLLPSLRLGFIGSGQMARAICLGLLDNSAIQPASIWCSDSSEKQMNEVKKRGVNTTTDNLKVVQHCNVILLCVKPNIITPVLTEVASHIRNNHLLISIAAGITIEQMECVLPERTRVVRVMPNTPALVASAASAFALGSAATRDDAAVVERLLSCIGVAAQVIEKDLDAVTGLSGSGPAYVFMFIEALADGGVRAGLSRSVAHEFAVQTVYGAAKMILESQQHPAQLKDSVASPGGTTIAGIHALENGTFRGTVMTAVMQAAQKSKELGEASKAERDKQQNKIQQ